MDSLSSRGRGRKRHTLPTSSQPSSEFVEQPVSSETPAVAIASSSFTFSTPSPSASRETRMRTRQVESTNASPDDTSSKGGRSLRKRPRVDYTFEQLEDIESSGAKIAPNTTRAFKRRKTEFSNENDGTDDSDARTKRRASEQPQPTTRRRNYTRKSTVEPQTYVPQHQMEDVEVQDTIEVGGHHSEESDESILRRTSTGSSNDDSKAAQLTTSFESLNASQDTELTQSSQDHQSSQTNTSHLPNVSQPKSVGNIQNGVEAAYEVESQDQQGLKEPLKNGPADADSDEDELELLDHLDHLTPYIQGSYLYYPEFQEDELEVDNNADAYANSEADSDASRDADADANEVDAEANTGADAENKIDTAAKEGTVAHDQTNGAVETPLYTTTNSPSAEAERANAQPVEKKQFRFKQLRQASDFTDLFKDVKSLSDEELQYRLEVTNRSLVTWQNEFNKERKHTDDYDNSVRWHKEEEAFERRYQMAVAKNPDANPIRKDFVVKGIRAPKTMPPEEEYIRQQDKIQANAYGFEYDPREDKIGDQDPIAQRTGLGRHGRLRERPKLTAKAAEAEDPPVTQSKRTRKAPERYDGGEAPSRGSTPAPPQRRGRRGAQVQENDVGGDQNQNQNQNQNQTQNKSQTTVAPQPAPEPVEQQPPKKKGKGGRPRKHPLPQPVAEAEPTQTAAPEPKVETNLQQPEPEPEPLPRPQSKGQSKSQPKFDTKTQPKTESQSDLKSAPKRGAEAVEEDEEQPTRKRRRRVPAAVSVPASAPVVEEGVDLANGTEPPAAAKPKPAPRRKNAQNPENPAEEPRPPTASSTATNETMTSTNNYSLREKRQRKFTNDVDDDFIEEPQRKRTRRAAPKKTKTTAKVTVKATPALDPVPEPTPAPMPEPAPAAPPAARGPTRIKLKVSNHAALSRIVQAPPSTSSAPAGGSANGAGATTGGGAAGPHPKAYNEMSKSEKMSHSMKCKYI